MQCTRRSDNSSRSVPRAGCMSNRSMAEGIKRRSGRAVGCGGDSVEGGLFDCY